MIFIAKKANSLTFKHRAVVAGTLGTWSPEAEALTRKALWLAEQGGRGRRYDGYSGLARCPYLLKALGRYGPGAKAAVPELRELLTHRDRYVRRAVLMSSAELRERQNQKEV